LTTSSPVFSTKDGWLAWLPDSVGAPDDSLFPDEAVSDPTGPAPAGKTQPVRANVLESANVASGLLIVLLTS